MLESKSLLRRLLERGHKVSLEEAPFSVKVIFVTVNGNDVPAEWREKTAKIIAYSIRQIKQNGDVTSNEVDAFFSGGGMLIEELSIDMWLSDYSKMSIN